MTSSLTVYRASAGSGKTFNLVLQYLLLALNRPHEFKNILAITFTNKATEEFKKKLFSYLHGISTGSNEENIQSMVNELVKLGLKEKTIKQNSSVLLSLMLHNFSDISIMTIDAFLSRILKSFSLELNLNIGNEIEIDTGRVLNEIIDDFLSNLEEDKYETEILQKFLIRNVTQAKSRSSIENNILSVSKEIFKDRYNLLYENSDRDRDEKTYLDFIKSLENFKHEFEQNLKRYCKEAIDIMISHGLAVTDFRSSFMKYIDKIQHAHYRDDFEIAATVFKVLNEGKSWTASKLDKKLIPVVENCINSGLLDKLHEIKSFYKSEHGNYISTNLVLENIYSVALLKILKSRLYEYQSTNNLTLISELNNFISKLIIDQDIPYLYEKTGLFYKYILIDEFQDTSRLQFQNLKPLVENSLSTGSSVFFVGDEKQSIYRFRDAFPETLIEIESHFDYPITIQDLTENFRSCENIINFNNEFFSSALSELNNHYIDKAYSKIKQTPRNKKEGYVYLEFIDNENSRSKNKWKEAANKKLYEIINNQIALGYNYKDILVLVNTNKEGLDIIKYLKNRMRNDGVHYEILSAESLKLKYSPEIIFLLSLMTYLYDFNNTLAAYEIFDFYLSHISPESKPQIINQDFSNELLQKILPADFYEHRIAYLKLPVVELVLKLIEIFDLYKFSGNFLSKFIDIISQYSSKYESDIKSFLEWWEDNSDDFSISVPEGLDAVEIMSIHKSKGLEREIVIIPYCEFTFNPNGNQDTLWATHSTEGIKLDVLMKATQGLSDSLFSEVYLKESDKIRLDNLNKLYVALTRAKEKLFIFSKLPTKSEKASSASTLLYNVVSADAFSLAQNWDKENKKFELGENNTNLNINTDASNSLIITDYKKTDWRKEIIIKNSIDADKLLNEDIQAGLLEGNIIHKIFSNMFFIEDLDAAINKIYFEGLISSDQIAKIKNDITELLNISEVNSWFSEKDALIYNEKEIILSNGEIIRPDKMIIKNNEIKLIDFKSTTTMLAEHSKQMKSYEKALLDMNFKNIEKYILYTRLKNVKTF